MSDRSWGRPPEQESRHLVLDVDVERIEGFYIAATARLQPGEKRVGAFEGTIGPRINWLTRDLLDPWQASRLFALTDRRLFVLRIGRFTDKASRLVFSDARHSVRLLSHDPFAGAGGGRLRIKRATGKVLGVNYLAPWRDEVERMTRWLVK